MTDNIIIDVKGLYKTFDKKKMILQGITCQIKRGEKIVIIGPSGGGKSTFLRCLNLLEKPTCGEIWVNDKLITPVDPYLHFDVIEASLTYGKLFEKKKAEVIFALENGKEVGFALFFHNFSTFLGRAGIYLEDLFVMPEYRGRGHGKRLIRELARITVERGCGRLEWCCLDWNKPSIDFYLSLGACPLDEWTTYRLTGENLKSFAEDK